MIGPCTGTLLSRSMVLCFLLILFFFCAKKNKMLVLPWLSLNAVPCQQPAMFGTTAFGCADTSSSAASCASANPGCAQIRTVAKIPAANKNKDLENISVTIPPSPNQVVE